MSVGLFRLLDDPAPQPKVFTARLEAAPGRIAAHTGELIEVASAESGTLYLHPRYATFLRRCGLSTAQAIYDLPGEVVSGHPDRHVVRVKLQHGAGERTVYLKREHIVGLRAKWKNRRAGFGWMTRSEREALLLKHLEAKRLPAPQWLAHGVDARGRGFLLVDELPTAVEVGTYYGKLTRVEQQTLARNVGRVVAGYHAAGITTPDLCWKHLFADPTGLAVTLIDWQSADKAATDAEAALRTWASLNASLPSEVSESVRLRAVVAYRRELKALGIAVTFRLRDLLSHSASLKSRSRLKDQRTVGAAPVWRWLAGEAVCVLTDVAAAWPSPADGAPFYGPRENDELLTLADGRRCRIERCRTFDPLGRLLAVLREKPWRSPAARTCRVLVHLARHNIAAPRVVAFGQKLTNAFHAESFVLTDACERSPALAVMLTQKRGAERQELLTNLGAFLAAIHAGGVAATACCSPALGMNSNGRLRVESSSCWELRKRMSKRDAVRNLADVLATAVPGLSPRDRLLVIRGYLGPTGTRKQRRVCFRWIERRNGRSWSI